VSRVPWELSVAEQRYRTVLEDRSRRVHDRPWRIAAGARRSYLRAASRASRLGAAAGVRDGPLRPLGAL
jgi:hypothetical protein